MFGLVGCYHVLRRFEYAHCPRYRTHLAVWFAFARFAAHHHGSPPARYRTRRWFVLTPFYICLAGSFYRGSFIPTYHLPPLGSAIPALPLPPLPLPGICLPTPLFLYAVGALPQFWWYLYIHHYRVWFATTARLPFHSGRTLLRFARRTLPARNACHKTPDASKTLHLCAYAV